MKAQHRKFKLLMYVACCLVGGVFFLANFIHIQRLENEKLYKKYFNIIIVSYALVMLVLLSPLTLIFYIIGELIANLINDFYIIDIASNFTDNFVRIILAILCCLAIWIIFTINTGKAIKKQQLSSNKK